MNVLENTLAFVFALGIIIFVHEAGHLLMAKAFGVRVLTFSLGFGKRLFGFERGGTDYRVSIFPLGGYVRLGGESAEEATGEAGEFLGKPRWQRILVYLAGPVMNIVLSVGLFAALFMIGIEVPNLSTIPSVVGGVEAGSSAAQAGIQKGDRLVSVGGQDVENWEEALFALLTSPGRPIEVGYERDGQVRKATVTPGEDPKYKIGDTAGIAPSVRPQFIEITKGSPAAAAGLQSGDEVLSVNGRQVAGGRDFVDAIEAQADKQVALEIRRGRDTLTIPVVPRSEDGKGKIGVRLGLYQRYPPAQAFQASVSYNIQIVKQMFQVFGKIFDRQLSAKSALAGPIEIAAQSGEAARAGFKHLLYLMGFISISIAVLNLLPIPILDGGQIAILGIETLVRRDLPLKFKEVVTQIGFVMILGLMAVVLWFDLEKNLPWKKSAAEAPAPAQQTAPSPTPAPKTP